MMRMAERNSVRCLKCRMFLDLCVCDILPRYQVKTRLVVFMQRTEFNFLSNTGRFVPQIFSNAEIRFRGQLDKTPIDTDGIASSESEPFVLFPTNNAPELNAEFVAKVAKPITLIVPDGNWRQAVKMLKRIKFLHHIPKVTLPVGRPSNYRLRVPPRGDGVCTYEAIARAMGILEGDKIQREMEAFFSVFVDRVLKIRGKK